MNLVVPDDQILLRKAEPIKFPDRSLSRVTQEMLVTMITNGGCGLAAPQVGLPIRIFTFRHGNAMGVVINPVILHRSPETVEFQEGCLTYPGRHWRTKRAKEIRIAYQSLDGSKVERAVDGLLAIIFQHESDHLDGVLISQHGVEVIAE
jgi:peptide deformylase